MVMRSEMCSTSRILWLIKMMDFPSLTSFFMMANRPSTSMSVSVMGEVSPTEANTATQPSYSRRTYSASASEQLGT